MLVLLTDVIDILPMHDIYHNLEILIKFLWPENWPELWKWRP